MCWLEGKPDSYRPQLTQVIPVPWLLVSIVHPLTGIHRFLAGG